MQVKEYVRLKSKIDDLTEVYWAETKRQSERKELITQLLKTKTMFSDEIEEFSEIIDKNDWSRHTCVQSKEYAQRVQNKAEYIAHVKAQIRPIKIGGYN